MLNTPFDHTEIYAGTPALAVVPRLDGPVPEITDEERDLACAAIDRHGLWSTDIPAMLGLVER